MLKFITRAVLCVIALVALFIGVVNLSAERITPPHTTSSAAYDLGMAAYRAQDYAEAERLLAMVPPDSPRYAKAMRWIGWEIRAKQYRNAPAGVAYVNRALMADPLDGNVWQDWYRTYLHSGGSVFD